MGKCENARQADVYAFGIVVVEVSPWHSCAMHRGLTVCLLSNPLKAFTGSPPFPELAPAAAVFKMVINRELPDRPKERGLTDPVWDMTLRCWQHEPDRRPKMTEVVATLREWQVFLSLEHEHCNMACFYFL